jgi:hypothetical protein
MKEADGDNAGQKADGNGQDDKPPVMLDRKASEYPQHLLSCSQTSSGPSQLTFCADRRAPLQSLSHKKR